MKSLDVLDIPPEAMCLSSIAHQIQKARHIKEPFSDSDILDLQDAFLCNGLHSFRVDDVLSGRSLINLFLSSLNCYHNVACLSMSSEPLDAPITDLYGELLIGRSAHHMEDFFLEQFYYDFVWVEATEKLVKDSVAGEFLNEMFHFKLDQLIPILLVSYKK